MSLKEDSESICSPFKNVFQNFFKSIRQLRRRYKDTPISYQFSKSYSEIHYIHTRLLQSATYKPTKMYQGLSDKTRN